MLRRGDARRLPVHPRAARPPALLGIYLGINLFAALLVGVGPGAGMGVVFLFTAIAVTDMSLAGYLYRAVRNVESDRVLVSAER